MPSDEIPAAVLSFIIKRIDSVTELETLLIMSAEESREWSIDEIAARIYTASPSAAAVLQALRRRNLVSVNASGTRFQFSPSSEDERQVVVQTATAYRANLISIATLIHNKASGPVQEFARAFSLKKDH